MFAKVIILIADVWAIVCILRMLLHRGGLSADQPAMKFCKQFTDPLIIPLGRLSRKKGSWDFSCLLAAFVVYYLVFLTLIFMALPSIGAAKAIFGASLFGLVGLSKAIAYALLLGLVTRMVLSIIKPYAPIMDALRIIFEPLSKPFVFLRIGRYDFSGSIVAIVLWLWLTVLVPQLMSQLNMLMLQ